MTSDTNWLIPLWLDHAPPRPDIPSHPAELIALRGVRESVSELFAVQVNIATHHLFVFIALLLLRLIFRRTWIAIAIHGTLYVFVYGSGFGFVTIAIYIAVWYLIMFRFGWVSIFVGALIGSLLNGYPLSSDLSAWYAHAPILIVSFCLALTIYAFKVALAGRPVFRDLLAKE